MAVTIYKKDGSERKVTWKAGEATGNGSIVVSGEVQTSAGRWAKPELEYSGTWMGETFVTLNISCAVPIDFEIGDYIVYRGEKFVINYDPTVIKKARRGTHGDGFVYDSVKFNSLSNELTDVRMLDYVINDNEIHYSGLPKFSFFCNNINDLADRLQVNTDRYCDANGIVGADRWVFITPNLQKTLQRCGSNSALSNLANAQYTAAFGNNGNNTATDDEKVNQNVSIDNQSVWDAMKYIKDTFGLNFIIRGRVVIIGAAGLPTMDVFKYGKGEGLYELERVADNDQQIVTKLYCYGSEKNLPTRYYANIGMECWSIIWKSDYHDEPFNLFYVPAKSDIFKKEVSIADPSIYVPTEAANLAGTTIYEVSFTYSGNTYQGYVADAAVIDSGGVDLTGFSFLFGADIPIFYGSETITFTGGIDKDKWPESQRNTSSLLPNEMAVNVLMLPGFPNDSLYDWVKANGGTDCVDATGKATWRGHTAYFSTNPERPYVQSLNSAELGIREATKYFDGSDGDEEIYPTIKNTGNDTIAAADTIQDNGIGTEMDNFYIYLPNFGNEFRLDELLQSDSAIEMTDGYCGARSFNIESATFEENRWKCFCQRYHDDDLDLWFPYQHGATGDAYQILSGDHYVLTGIEMTETYVNAAAVTLLEAALNFLEKNDYTRYTYSPKIDELFMARQHDGFTRGDESFGDRSYHDTLKEGDIMLFDDDDLDVDGSVYIDTLQIKEYGNGSIPTYEVTLRNDKQVGTIQRMQEQLNSLTSGGGGGVYGGGGGGGSVNIPQIRQLIQSYGKELFLSKVANDTAKGVITFLNGLQAGAEGAWGWVKETYNNLSGGVAWFKNLLADYLQPTIVKVMNYLTGNEGSLIIHGDVFVTADPENNKDGDLNLAGDLNAENANIRNMLTTNNLTVTGLAHFFELIIDKIKAAGGAQLFTPADGFKVEDVTDTTINNTACKVLWWRATDGDRETENMWEVGDQAICMNFNLTREREGEVMRDVENKNFWALVAEKDDNPVLHTYGSSSSSSSSSSDEEDTVLSHYITIYTGSSTTDSAEPLNPRWINNAYKVAIGDEIAMLGHRFTDADYENGVLKEEAKARQSAVYISAYASYDTGNGDDLGPLQPPFLAFYKGIDDFNLGSHRGTYMDAKGSRFVGKFISSSTSQDIENMLRGSEFDIIYGVGNPNTVSHPHYAWNQEAGEYLSHVGWLYFDIDLEPATEGGRLWRWSYIDSDSSSSSSDEPYFTWVNINDVDSLAALDKIRDVASDGKLSGGAEKTRVYLEWLDAKKTFVSLWEQANENNEDGDWTDPTSELTYKDGVTYYHALTTFSTAFYALSTYLNDKSDYISGIPKWIDPSNNIYGLKVTTELPAWLDTETPQGKAAWTTGPLAYRGVWDDFYDAVTEMARALNAWQYRVIDEMGDDGMIDAAEKALLRQTFNDLVIQFCNLYKEADIIENKITGSTQETDLYNARTLLLNYLNDLGTYLDDTIPSGSESSSSSDEASWHFDNWSWFITPVTINDFANGLVDPPDVGDDPLNIYPAWLQKDFPTESVFVKDPQWDYFWDRFIKTKQTLLDAMEAGRQYQLDHVDAELPQAFYTDSRTTNTAPNNTHTTPNRWPKVGDMWYEWIKLTNPVTNDPVQYNSNNQPLYRKYVCKQAYTSAITNYNNKGTYWNQVDEPVVAISSTDVGLIYTAVFNSEEFSSIEQRVNSITSTVSGMVNPSRNLLINGDFSDGTNHFATSGNASIEVVTGQGAANFSNTLKVTSVSGSACGIQFSINEQPYITLEEGKKYTLSFYAMASSSKTIYVQRPGSISSGKSISSTWGRYSQTFTGDGLAKTFSIVDATSNTTTYYITGLQLEVGNSYTDWVAGSINLVNMQSQIVQTASEIELSVKKDGVESCGLKIDGINDTTTLYGNKVVIDGDLDIRGLTTENVTIVERNHNKPTVINMGIVADSDSYNNATPTKIKSVQVKAVGQGYSTQDANPDYSHMVVLPFYDSLVGSGTGWPSADENLINFETSDSSSKTYRSFMLYTDNSVNESERRVVTWRQNGTKLTITNEVDPYCSNWPKLDTDAYGSTARKTYGKWLLKRSVVICADGRIPCKQNVLYVDQNTPQPFIGSYAKTGQRGLTPYGNNPKCKAGRLLCNGYVGRFLVLFPGQTAQLKSQIMQVDTNQEVLVWVVENGYDFDLLQNNSSDKHFWIEFDVYGNDGNGNQEIGFCSTATSFDPASGHTSNKEDNIFGPSVANAYDNSNIGEASISFTNLY